MKVLHLEFGRNLYGGALQVAYLLKGLAADHPEIENHLVLPPENPLAKEFPEGAPVQVHDLKSRGELDPRIYLRLKRVVRRTGPDLIHIHSRRGADSWGVLLARWAGLPYVLSRRVAYPEASRLIRWRTARAACVVGISRRITEMMAEAGVPPSRLRCILSAVDTKAYSPREDTAYFREQTGLGPETPVVAMIGQFIAGKGHRVLLEAVPGILEKHPETRFLLFGRGRLEEALRAAVAAESWRDHIVFMGFRTDLARLMSGFQVVAHPAFAEGLGVSLLQASACAVPIVASRAGGIPEVVHDGETGFLIEPGDSAALSRHVANLLGDGSLRGRTGSSGRRLVEERFSISRMVTEYVNLYRAIPH